MFGLDKLFFFDFITTKYALDFDFTRITNVFEPLYSQIYTEAM